MVGIHYDRIPPAILPARFYIPGVVLNEAAFAGRKQTTTHPLDASPRPPGALPVFPLEELPMNNAIVQIPFPANEPVFSYAPGTRERRALKEQLARMLAEEIEIPLVIGGKEVRTGNLGDCRCPHDHRHVLASYHQAGAAEKWSRRSPPSARRPGRSGPRPPWERAGRHLPQGRRAARRPYRHVLNAATMLGQSKTVYQAEIDAACELIDFFRFNPYYMQRDLRASSRDSRQRHLELRRVPAAGGLRLRGDAVQLHLHRRQPADRAGADGQHRPLEARLAPRSTRRYYHHAAPARRRGCPTA